MRYYNILNISLQQIQIFLKVIELRNYTRVAEYFNFTVSMISKTISNMEKEMGLIDSSSEMDTRLDECLDAMLIDAMNRLGAEYAEKHFYLS